MTELRLEALQCGYQTPLCNLTLRLQTGEHIWFHGQNGIGKSTLLKTLAGLHPPLGGRIWFNGQDLQHKKTLRQQIFYLPETIQVPDFLTPIEYVRLIAAFYGEKPDPQRLKAGIALLDITAYQNRPLGKCSQGQKRRSQLLAVYVLQKPLILCDDPLIGIDRARSDLLLAFLQQLTGGSIVVMAGREPLNGLSCHPL